MASRMPSNEAFHLNLRYKDYSTNASEADDSIEEPDESFLSDIDADAVLEQLCPGLDLSDLRWPDKECAKGGRSEVTLLEVKDHPSSSHANYKEQVISGVLKDFLPHCDSAKPASSLLPSPLAERLPPASRYPNKPVAFTREQARQWRRKRLLQPCSSVESSGYSSASSRSSCSSASSNSQSSHEDQLLAGRQKAQTNRLRRQIVRPANEIVLKKLQDPLLGGERIRSNRGM